MRLLGSSWLPGGRLSGGRLPGGRLPGGRLLRGSLFGRFSGRFWGLKGFTQLKTFPQVIPCFAFFPSFNAKLTCFQTHLTMSILFAFRKSSITANG